MQPFILIHHSRYGWSSTMMLALIIGLVVSSVFTGLSVGLPLGLACCTSGKQQNLLILLGLMFKKGKF